MNNLGQLILEKVASLYAGGVGTLGNTPDFIEGYRHLSLKNKLFPSAEAAERFEAEMGIPLSAVKDAHKAGKGVHKVNKKLIKTYAKYGPGESSSKSLTISKLQDQKLKELASVLSPHLQQYGGVAGETHTWRGDTLYGVGTNKKPGKGRELDSLVSNAVRIREALMDKLKLTSGQAYSDELL